MDHIDTHLATAAIENKYPLAIKAALAIGKKTLNRYYDKTDHSEVFRIAMSKIFQLSKNSSKSFLFISSTASSSQGRIFQECKLVGRVDRGGNANCPGQI